MDRTDIVFFAEAGVAPALEWLLEQPPKVQDKFDFLFKLLEEKGSMLQRPHAAPLEKKIYELRARHQQVNYRLLYFFHGTAVAIVAHGCTKESAVDKADIERAVNRLKKFTSNPSAHTFRE